VRLVRQKHPEGCGVAAFAMLTGRTYNAAVKHLGFDGEAIDFRNLRRALEMDGCFCRSVLLRGETWGDEWPPRPFAPRHFACVTSPSGNGHYVVMNHVGVVLDPLRTGEHRLTDWKVVSEVCGVL
jgi:hypothetical protein